MTAAMFGALAGYGTLTRPSGIFLQSNGLQFVIAFMGVIVFTGLAAYDAQRLKAMALSTPEGQTGSYAIVGALALYLDFINLFLMLLRLFGGRRR